MDGSEIGARNGIGVLKRAAGGVLGTLEFVQRSLNVLRCLAKANARPVA